MTSVQKMEERLCATHTEDFGVLLGTLFWSTLNDISIFFGGGIKVQ